MSNVHHHQDGHFRVGDLVTRDGTDIHRVIEAEWINGYAPDIITVECVKEPLGWLQDDGSRDEPWTKIGETEQNMARRYRHAGNLIEQAMANRVTPFLEAKLVTISTPR